MKAISARGTLDTAVSDAAIVEQSLGSPATFGAIFDRHATAIHCYLVRRVGPDTAEGLLGDCFRVAFERRASYHLSRGNARPWLYGIATNLVASHRRNEARRSRALDQMAAEHQSSPDRIEEATAAVAARQRLGRVLLAIDDLPEAERDPLLLHVWEGLSYDEVAQALDIPVGTVRSRIHRARQRLQKLSKTAHVNEKPRQGDRP